MQWIASLPWTSWKSVIILTLTLSCKRSPKKQCDRLKHARVPGVFPFEHICSNSQPARVDACMRFSWTQRPTQGGTILPKVYYVKLLPHTLCYISHSPSFQGTLPLQTDNALLFERRKPMRLLMDGPIMREGLQERYENVALLQSRIRRGSQLPAIGTWYIR